MALVHSYGAITLNVLMELSRDCLWCIAEDFLKFAHPHHRTYRKQMFLVFFYFCVKNITQDLEIYWLFRIQEE